MLFQYANVLKSHGDGSVNNSIVTLSPSGKDGISTSSNKEHKEMVLAPAQKMNMPRHMNNLHLTGWTINKYENTSYFLSH